MNIRKAIQFCRCQCGLSQKQLGKLIGSDAGYINLIETGKRTPNLGTINKLCVAMDISALVLIFLSLNQEEKTGLGQNLVKRLELLSQNQLRIKENEKNNAPTTSANRP